MMESILVRASSLGRIVTECWQAVWQALFGVVLYCEIWDTQGVFIGVEGYYEVPQVGSYLRLTKKRVLDSPRGFIMEEEAVFGFVVAKERCEDSVDDEAYYRLVVSRDSSVGIVGFASK
jgi:hypothetical protein